MQKLEAKLPRGGRRRHGGYSYLTSHRIPDDKIYVERYLTNLRESYVLDLGESEADLTTGQLVLLDTLITLKGINRCVEIESSRDGNLARLDERYNARNNQIIKICLALGIDRNETGREITPRDQAEIIRADLRTDESKK